MKVYLGRKIVHAMPMNLGDYNQYQGWTIPEDQDPETEGFLVEYTDGGDPNHPKHSGYISWSPKDVFVRSYQEIDPSSQSLNFGQAVEIMKGGGNVQRRGWNGKGMYIFLARTEGVDPYFIMKTAQNTMQPGWLASQADMLSEDWQLVTLTDGE